MHDQHDMALHAPDVGVNVELRMYPFLDHWDNKSRTESMVL